MATRPNFNASRPASSHSAGQKEWALLIASSALALYGLTRRSVAGFALAAAGGAVAFKGAAAMRTGAKRVPAIASFTVNCSPEHAYQFWRNFENLPRFMRHLDSVRSSDGNRSVWTALGPFDQKISWTAEITQDQPNERIAWRSLPGSEVTTSGEVQFRPATANRGTVVTAKLEYQPPSGQAGHLLAALAGKNPKFTVREELRRFKALMETGEVPTTKGQSHGPRGLHGHAHEVLLREKQNMPEPPIQQEERRIA